MESREPTIKEQEIFDLAFDNGIEPPNNISMLYHYRSGSSLDTIFREDGIRLRATLAENFPDKLEGRAVAVYYEEALDELLNENKITQEQYDNLSQIEMPEEEMFIFKSERIMISRDLKFEPYVACFSTEMNDPYMFENYGKNKKGKFCMGFYRSELENLTHSNMQEKVVAKLIPAMYGKQAVCYLKEKTLQVVQKTNLLKDAEILIPDILKALRYSAKRSKFAKDNEIRLVVCLPKDDDHGRTRYEIEKTKDGRYLWVRFAKHSVIGLWPDPNNDQVDNDSIREMLVERGYDHLITQ